MANILQDVQDCVVGKLSADYQLSGMCTFLSENRKDIDYEIKNALGREGLVAVVMTPKATYAGKYENSFLAWTLESLEIDIVENVTVNRGKKNGFMTGQDVGLRVFDVLCPLDGEEEGKFNPVSLEEGEDNGLLVNKCLLKALVYGEHGDIPQPEKPLTYQFVKLLDQAPPLSVQPHDGWMWETDDGFVLYKDHVIHNLGVNFSEMSSYVQSQISSKADISSLHQDYIVDNEGNSVSADLNVMTHREGQPYWNLMFNNKQYALEGTKDYSSYEPSSSQHFDGEFKGTLSWSSNDQMWTLHYMTYDAGTSEWYQQEDLYDTTSGHDALSLEFNIVSFDSCIWTTPEVLVNEHLATQEWVIAQLSALQARIAQLENNL